LLRYANPKGASEKEAYGAEESTTNNRMELKAAIEGLRALNRPCSVNLYCDSQYVAKGINEWLAAWKARGWRRADKSPVLNADLWQELDMLLVQHSVKALWVRGHSGHPENDKVDKMAREAALG
jgi:ribonuclease HI